MCEAVHPGSRTRHVPQVSAGGGDRKAPASRKQAETKAVCIHAEALKDSV